MQLLFEITEGEELGARFEIKPGMTLGRKNADLLLKDSKVSIRHAIVERRENNKLFLVDAGSSNGLKVDGVKVMEVELIPGASVRVGRSILTVVGTESWDTAFIALARTAKERFKNKAAQVTPFSQLVELKFLQGRQAGTSWVVGYGPRKIGHSTLDLRLEEPNIPDVCFELTPLRQGAQFRTEFPDKVKLNGAAVNEAKVENGDIIEIHKTRIEINFKADD